jgi:hypothetical protein
MGTSNAFKGSGGKDTQDLQDAIAGWLDDLPSAPTASSSPAGAADEADSSRIETDKLKPALRLLGGRTGGGGRSRSSTGPRSSGGPDRSVTRSAQRAGRAAAAASAYRRGDRETLRRLGLDYDELTRLNDPLEISARIVEATSQSHDGAIEDYEERLIAANLAQWILDAPADQNPTIGEIVRKSIELMIAEITLAEVGDQIRSKGTTPAARRAAEAEIRAAAEVMASQVTLPAGGIADAELSTAIENGVEELGRIFGVK